MDESGCGHNGFLPVAAYARMSSDSQRHSVQQQLDAISIYAQAHSMRIVRTFVDEGRSGLTLRDRDGLQSLLVAVTEVPCAFGAVIVYDVSRWGRFQDVDESAFYEYLCRRAGVRVVYCAEPFPDDGSPMQALLKGIKRIMAAEYSRELSAKVWQAQCRFVRMGFKQGGLPGYGLSRVAVSSEGVCRARLLPGERKPALTDRVALSPSGEGEVALVRRIYAMYLQDGLGDSAIARQLRSEGRRNHLGKEWDAATVRRILTSEKYCGALVFNQTTRKLRRPVKANPETAWVRCDTALQPMVSRETFMQAQRLRDLRAGTHDRERIIHALRAIHARHGKINAALCRDPSLPGRATMNVLFGGYVAAYAEAGLPVQRTASGALAIGSTRVMMRDLINACICRARQGGASVDRTVEWNILLLNGSLRLKVSLASCRAYPDGSCRWRVPVHKGVAADFVLCALMDRGNEQMRHFLLLPVAAFIQDSVFIAELSLARYERWRFDSLDAVFGLA